MSKYSKRLTLRLPADHPIFNYPEGARAEIARNWLDIGSKLEFIQDKLENFSPEPSEQLSESQQSSEQPANHVSTSQIDVKEFLKNIEDVL